MPAANLISLVESLGAPYGLERSVKIMPGRVADDRCLISVGRGALGRAPLDRLLRIGQELGMPTGFVDALPAALDRADIVHFGYEGAGTHGTYKMYFEYASDARAAMTAGSPVPVLVHLAYKWTPPRPDGAVTRYTWAPCRTRPEVEAKLRSLLPAERAPRALGCALRLLSKAASSADAGELLLMEVEEAGNPRRSCDLNVYDAGLRLCDIADLLESALRDFGVTTATGESVFGGSASKALGHLSAGVGRDGEEFVTIYFGVEGH